MKHALLIGLLSLLLLNGSAFAAEQPETDEPSPPEKTEPKKAEERSPVPEAKVTHHQIALGGQAIKYPATVGWLIIVDIKKSEPIARFGYTAYTLDGVKNA